MSFSWVFLILVTTLTPAMSWAQVSKVAIQPWMTATIKLSKNGKVTCSGSLVSPNVVVTAASCVLNPNLLYQSYGNPDSTKPEQFRTVEGWKKIAFDLSGETQTWLELPRADFDSTTAETEGGKTSAITSIYVDSRFVRPLKDSKSVNYGFDRAVLILSSSFSGVPTYDLPSAYLYDGFEEPILSSFSGYSIAYSVDPSAHIDAIDAGTDPLAFPVGLRALGGLGVTSLFEDLFDVHRPIDSPSIKQWFYFDAGLDEKKNSFEGLQLGGSKGGSHVFTSKRFDERKFLVGINLLLRTVDQEIKNTAASALGIYEFLQKLSDTTKLEMPTYGPIEPQQEIKVSDEIVSRDFPILRLERSPENMDVCVESVETRPVRIFMSGTFRFNETDYSFEIIEAVKRDEPIEGETAWSQEELGQVVPYRIAPVGVGDWDKGLYTTIEPPHLPLRPGGCFSERDRHQIRVGSEQVIRELAFLVPMRVQSQTDHVYVALVPNRKRPIDFLSYIMEFRFSKRGEYFSLKSLRFEKNKIPFWDIDITYSTPVAR